ncbi:glycogen-binding domain-containing protein [Spirochaetota bacterium]
MKYLLKKINMLINTKKWLFFLIVFLISSTTHGNLETLNFYQLKFLKQSDPPRVIRMIKVDNLSRMQKIVSPGILFTYKNRKAQKVSIAGNFSQWNLIHMRRGNNGVWYFFSKGNFNDKKIKYKFNVDDIWISDPKNPIREDDGIGSYVSITSPVKEKDAANITYRLIRKNLVEFRLYNPGARIISLVGDFNNWNPESDLLIKDKGGFWKLRKRLTKGLYKYKYIVDGKWTWDYFNPKSASDMTGDLCSVIVIK